jgi:hypothetical protein
MPQPFQQHNDILTPMVVDWRVGNFTLPTVVALGKWELYLPFAAKPLCHVPERRMRSAQCFTLGILLLRIIYAHGSLLGQSKLLGYVTCDGESFRF